MFFKIPPLLGFKVFDGQFLEHFVFMLKSLLDRPFGPHLLVQVCLNLLPIERIALLLLLQTPLQVFFLFLAQELLPFLLGGSRIRLLIVG